VTAPGESDGQERPPWAVAGEPLGDPTRWGLHLNAVALTGGQRLTLPGPGVTAIVGANNSGKSTLLRQLHYSLSSPGGTNGEPVQLVTDVEVAGQGSGSDFLAWLMQHARYRPDPSNLQGNSYLVNVTGQELPIVTYRDWWNQDRRLILSSLTSLVVHNANASDRLMQALGAAQRNDVAEPPTHPLHHLQDDAVLRTRLDELSQRIFRQPLTLDDLSAGMRLRVGQPDVEPPRRDESQRPYRDALARLPPLEQQGDGMKSLLGLLLPLITRTYPIILVDEPEAFLHPPQAYQLGRVLGELARDAGVQLILATHDRNLLAGLLAAEAPLSVVRLTRNGTDSRVAQLDPEQVRHLWTDPVLRYSNVLDGLFHQLVVLAENDRDCRFYAAALDAAEELGSPLPVPPADVLFVPTHGKAAMARLATLLRAVAVPVIASPDLDILRDRAELVALVESLGHDSAGLRTDYDLSTHPFRQPQDATRVADVRDAVLAVLDQVLADNPEARYDTELRQRITTALRTPKGRWQEAKKYGTLAFSGQAAAAVHRLLGALEQRGVVPVRVGELERFAPELDVPKGKDWLSAALAAGAHRDQDAQEHVRRLVAGRPDP
jgi:predicted ATPase